MTDKPSMKEVRGYIRQTVQRLEAFKVLDEQLEDAADLSAVIAKLESMKEKAEGEIHVAEHAAAAAREEENKAKARAKEILADADKIRKDAEKRALSVDAIVEGARAEADRLIGEGRRVGEALAADLEGRIGALQKDVNEIDKRKTQLANDVAALETRKQSLRADINRIAQSLAESA